MSTARRLLIASILSLVAGTTAGTAAYCLSMGHLPRDGQAEAKAGHDRIVALAEANGMRMMPYSCPRCGRKGELMTNQPPDSPESFPCFQCGHVLHYR